MKLEPDSRIYFIGIGGIAMSATAGLAKQKGYQVFGTDKAEIYSPSKDVLVAHQINYLAGYSEQNIQQHPADIYIVSAGEDENNPEVKFLLDNNVPLHSFSQLLAELFESEIRIVVGGTHGKSTTAGLLGHILKNIDDSSFMVGAVLQNYNSNYYAGTGHYAVFEGDEYKATFDDPTPKFHFYKPDILVLTNLEHDHPDLYSDFQSMRREFELLVSNLPSDGLLIYNADDPSLVQLAYDASVHSYGFSLNSESNFQVDAISQDQTGVTGFSILRKDNQNQIFSESYSTILPGKINIYNALAAATTLRVLGFQPELIQSHLITYAGVKRRFEIIGEMDGITVVDDYAHHPTAVRETLAAAKLRFPGRRVWAVFEPHTYSRTASTLEGLAGSFNDADYVLISDIYPARESQSGATIQSEQVVEAVLKKNSQTRLVHSKAEAMAILKKEAQASDVIVVMAVGNFNRLAYDLIKKV